MEKQEKSVLWIGANIAAGILIITLIIRFIGSGIFWRFIAGNTVMEIGLGIVLLLVGVWLGSMFGVKYVARRSRINLEKIKKISITAVVIPFVFFLLFIILDIWIASTELEEFKFPLDSLIATLIAAVAIFFFVRRYLRKSIETP